MSQHFADGLYGDSVAESDGCCKGVPCHVVGQVLRNLGNLLLKKQPDFDSRCFGYPKLSVMFESLEDLYIIEKRAIERAQGFQIFVRRK